MIKRRKKKEIEPLKKVPDYRNQRRTGVRHTALNINRIYFVDEDYQKLVVSAGEIIRGDNPTRFTGMLPFIPEQGDILSNEDFSEKFEVLRRHLIPNLSANIPPKVYIVLKKIE